MHDSMTRRLTTYLRGEKEHMTSMLERFVKAESPSTVPKAQDNIFALLDAELTTLDYATMRVCGRLTGGYLYARPERRTHGRPYQLLLGHCDTVWPIGTIEERPFTVEDGIARGPGVFDMKGGLVQMLFALRALRELDLATPVTPVVLINSDEEIGSRESDAQIRRLSRCADRALVLEPALGRNGKIKTSRRGSGKFFIRVTGRQAHPGLDPEMGASAILELSHIIQALHGLNDRDRGISVIVGMIQGGVSANVVAPESSAVVDVRVTRREDGERIACRIRGLRPSTPGTSVRIEGMMGRDPMESTPRNRRLWKRAEDLGRRMNLSLEEGRSGGVSDANTATQYTATLDGLGPVGDGAHARHEYIQIERMPERTALLVLLLMEPPLGAKTRAVREISGFL